MFEKILKILRSNLSREETLIFFVIGTCCCRAATRCQDIPVEFSINFAKIKKNVRKNLYNILRKLSHNNFF